MTGETPTLGTSVLDDEELIRKARAVGNERQFRLLYDQGWNSPTVRRVYGKPRRARLALVDHLVWWTRHDFGQVRRLFGRSALCPGDIDRCREYFRSLVRSAVNLLGDECYDPNRSGDDTNWKDD